MQFVLFGEIVLAQKVMYDKFGDDFLFHFVLKGFSSAHCPPDLADQYRQKLQVIRLNGAVILNTLYWCFLSYIVLSFICINLLL